MCVGSDWGAELKHEIGCGERRPGWPTKTCDREVVLKGEATLVRGQTLNEQSEKVQL